MNNESKLLSRRTVIQMGAGLPLSAMLLSCGGNSTQRTGKAAPKSKINQESYWARRQEWKGEEWVYGIVQISDRTLMVNRNDGMGWSFPGGRLDAIQHGEKHEKNDDIINAATVFVHDQTLIPVLAKEAIIIAYGYVIDERGGENKLVHWVNVFCLGDDLPRPQAGLNIVKEAQWAAGDDPYLGACLTQRLKEVEQAGEGKTLIIRSCGI